MMYEIVTIPWIDHDKGESYWIRSTYWAHSEEGIDGDECEFTVDSCSDGDHQPVDHDEIPTWHDAQIAWDDYYLDVIETGEDPLCEFLVQHQKRTVQRWQVWFAKSIAGVMVQRVRRAGKEYRLWELPKSISDYLVLKDDGTSSNTEATLQDLENEGLKLNRWETIRLEQKEFRSESAVKRDIQRMARKAYNSRAGRNNRSHLNKT